MENPKLRPVEAFEYQDSICISDPFKYTNAIITVPRIAFYILSLFDGNNSIDNIKRKFEEQFETKLPDDQLNDMIKVLDENYFLDNNNFFEFKRSLEENFSNKTVIEMTHSKAAYPSEKDELENMMKNFFDNAKEIDKTQNPSAIIVPHIDIRIAGTCYAAGYKSIHNIQDYDLIGILGTNHMISKNMFSTTDKDFETPFGTLKTDSEFVDRIIERLDYNPKDDELAFRTEHSVEFQTIFLKYLEKLCNSVDLKILPVLVGSFYEILLNNIKPENVNQFTSFVDTIKDVIAETGKKVLWISSVDFSHVGKKFGDQEDFNDDFIDSVKVEDKVMIEHLKKVDKKAFFDMIKSENDKRKVCGFPSIYTLLSLIDSKEGVLIDYEGNVEDMTQSMVTYASMSFY